MLLVGLTGGLASGKSTIARLFQEFGAAVIDADELARMVVRPGTIAWKEIVKAYGKKVLKPDRSLDRKALARIVFQHPPKLQTLTTIVHPRVARAQARITREIAAKDPDAVIIYDAALLIEARAHERMDRVLVVTADQETQIARACRRDGLSRSQALHRLRGQLPLAKKRRCAHYLLDGTLPIPTLRGTVRRLYQEFKRQAQGSRSSSSPELHKKTKSKKAALHFH